jgi:hypothetical protein
MRRLDFWMHEGVGFEGAILCACMCLCVCDCACVIRVVHMDEGACTNKTVTVTVRVSVKPAYLSLVCVWASEVALRQVCMFRAHSPCIGWNGCEHTSGEFGQCYMNYNENKQTQQHGCGIMSQGHLTQETIELST